MRWTITHKVIPDTSPNYGDIRIKKHFCLFPKSNYDGDTGSTTYYWLETVFIAYKWTEGINIEWDFSGLPVCEPDYWRRIGIATTYENASKSIWR